jgi:eukaryotic-like serine/threonine-protein kinase
LPKESVPLWTRCTAPAVEPPAFAELHRRVPAPPPSTRAPLAGPALDAVLLRALAKAPADRHASGAELAADLRDAVQADGSRAPRRPAAGA